MNMKIQVTYCINIHIVRELRLVAFVFFRVYGNPFHISCTYTIHTSKCSQEAIFLGNIMSGHKLNHL